MFRRSHEIRGAGAGAACSSWCSHVPKGGVEQVDKGARDTVHGCATHLHHLYLCLLAVAQLTADKKGTGCGDWTAWSFASADLLVAKKKELERWKGRFLQFFNCSRGVKQGTCVVDGVCCEEVMSTCMPWGGVEFCGRRDRFPIFEVHVFSFFVSTYLVDVESFAVEDTYMPRLSEAAHYSSSRLDTP